MPNHSSLSNESLPASSPEAERTRRLPLVHTLKAPAQFLSFWIAIALPFVHVPLLAQGLGDPTVTGVFLALLVLNALALYVGHGYNQH